MAAAVVELMHLARTGLVAVEELAVCRVKSCGKSPGLFVAGHVGKMFQRFSQGQELTQGIPTQMPFFLELLNMLGGRAATVR